MPCFTLRFYTDYTQYFCIGNITLPFPSAP